MSVLATSAKYVPRGAITFAGQARQKQTREVSLGINAEPGTNHREWSRVVAKSKDVPVWHLGIVSG